MIIHKLQKRWFALTSKFGVTRRRRGGFTLIELIVSIAIIGILVTLMLTNFKVSKDNLPLALEDFENHIREVQVKGNFSQIIGVCYQDDLPVGLCSKIPSCSDCRQEYPKRGYSAYATYCPNVDDQCFFLYADVGMDYEEQAENFSRVILPNGIISNLGNNLIRQICYSNSNAPDLPPFISAGGNYSCNMGWTAGTLFNANFDNNNTYLETLSPFTRDESIKYLAVRIENIKNNNQAYLYISSNGLISSGLLK